MARKKEKSPPAEEEVPAWMLTFSDLTTLLMTFFVLLVSMASLDDVNKRKVALGSVSGKFGSGAPRLDDLTTADATNKQVQPGPFNNMKQDLQELHDQLWDNPREDIRFESNKFIQRVVLDADALFASGTSRLLPQGQKTLRMLIPLLQKTSYPLTLSGHTAEGWEEFGPEYLEDRAQKVDFSWQLSLDRTLVVYRILLGAGISSKNIRLEAMGRYQPRDTQIRGPGSLNNRVEITLDKRIESWDATIARIQREIKDGGKERKPFSIKGFEFDFSLPGDGS